MQDAVEKKIVPNEAYRELSFNLNVLVDNTFNEAEKLVSEADYDGIIGRMPALISLTNTIGYLRGQHNLFLDSREKDPTGELTRILRRMEDSFEKRLDALITIIMESSNSEHAQKYKAKLELYFVKVRTHEHVTGWDNAW